MLETLDTVPWAEIPQPRWNTADQVAGALRSVVNSATKKDAEDAYHGVLYALGNNHAGTYYPVALWAVPFLGELLGHANPLVRETSLDVFIDLAGSFEPESGFETVRTPSGAERPLAAALHEAVAELRPMIEACASSEGVSSRERDLAAELLSLLRERLAHE